MKPTLSNTTLMQHRASTVLLSLTHCSSLIFLQFTSYTVAVLIALAAVAEAFCLKLSHSAQPMIDAGPMKNGIQLKVELVIFEQGTQIKEI